ncbi:cell division protein ZipA [Nitrincola tapanii]|uniref:Cell division protein ZipA n=1 Tax=Nitrincola tapanii TaxID=1708751 RepID=A0A5A9W5C1_9GAMM|nr:cell division protein ZipA [Nitrincola tapanii]KAA0874771.1 cell division protein ZipA [Nitrincola tapanii]
MEFSLREWLIVGGVILIALILFDGWRRIRANRNKLRLDIDKTLSELSEDETRPIVNPELPNGGARVRRSVETAAVSLQGSLQGLVPKEPKITRVEPEFNYAPEAVEEAAASSATPVALDAGFESTQSEQAEHAPLPSASAPITERADLATETEDIHRLQAEMEAELEAPSIAQVESRFAPEPAVAAQDEPSDPVKLEAVADLNLEIDERLSDPFVPESEPVTVSLPVADAAQVEDDEEEELPELDPLFDEIPETLPTPKSNKSKVRASTEDTHPDMFEGINLPLDLDKPVAEMVNSGARRARRKTHENPSFSLPLETELPEIASAEALEAELSFAQPEITPQALAKQEPKIDTLQQASLIDLELPGDETALDPIGSRTASQPPGFELTQEDLAGPAPEAAPPVARTQSKKAIDELPDPEEVLVITVVGRNRQLLDGPRLQRVVEACGMEFGDMSIFHRFEDKHPAAAVQFSMANAVSPGTFDLTAMETLETPAVSFFMSMREPKDAMNAYECMLATAETLARHLDGDLLDEDRSVMREQTKEHYRQRIRDFEMANRRAQRQR